jgi:hypothetical protein
VKLRVWRNALRHTRSFLGGDSNDAFPTGHAHHARRGSQRRSRRRYDRLREDGQMKMQGVGILLVLACCGASTAKADWEYTHWGMSPQEVVDASKNLAKEESDPRPDNAGNVTKLVAPYQSGNFSFEAQFAFDAADKLASVTLVMDDNSVSMEDFMDMGSMDMGSMNMGSMNMGSMGTDQGTCHDLDVSLNTTYGEALHGGAGHVYAAQQWQDQTNGNNVDYHALYAVGCYVQYSAITPTGAH